MNKYAKEYIKSFVGAVKEKTAVEPKNDIIGDYIVKPIIDNFRGAYSNARDAKDLYAAGQPDAAKAKTYQALGNFGLGVGLSLPVGRGASWVMRGAKATKPLLRTLSNAASTGGLFGGAALSAYGSAKNEKYELSKLKPHLDVLEKMRSGYNPE